MLDFSRMWQNLLALFGQKWSCPALQDRWCVPLNKPSKQHAASLWTEIAAKMGQRQPSLSGNLSDKASQTALRAFRRSPLRVRGRPLTVGPLTLYDTEEHLHTHAPRLWRVCYQLLFSSLFCAVKESSFCSSFPLFCPFRCSSSQMVNQLLPSSWEGGFLLGEPLGFCYVLSWCSIFLLLTRGVGNNSFVNILIGCFGEQSVSEHKGTF